MWEGMHSPGHGGPTPGGDMQLWARGDPVLEGTRSPTHGGEGSQEGGTHPWDRHSTQCRQGYPAPDRMYSPGYISGRDEQHGESHSQREFPARDVTRVPPSSPSRDMPTSRHFLKRHCWQRLRLMRTIEQFSFLRHFLYWMFCWMLRRKKPCGARRGESLGVPAV